MAAARILYVGDDICHRIPVMESHGVVVLRSAPSVAGVRSLLADGDALSGVAFQNDVCPPPSAVVSTARELSRAPLILLKNPMVECDERAFDIVIAVDGTAPAVWSKTLIQAVEEARRLREYSRQLRQDCAAARDLSKSFREMSMRNRIDPVDYEALFRTEADGAPKRSEDEGR